MSRTRNVENFQPRQLAAESGYASVANNIAGETANEQDRKIGKIF